MALEQPPAKRQKPPLLEQITVREYDWAYANLQMIFDPPNSVATSNAALLPDIITWRTVLTNALTQFLGITGSAIHLDILHLDRDEGWIRFPRADMKRFGAAVSGYVGTMDGRNVGFKTIAIGEFLMGVIGRKAEIDIWAE